MVMEGFYARESEKKGSLHVHELWSKFRSYMGWDDVEENPPLTKNGIIQSVFFVVALVAAGHFDPPQGGRSFVSDDRLPEFHEQASEFPRCNEYRMPDVEGGGVCETVNQLGQREFVVRTVTDSPITQLSSCDIFGRANNGLSVCLLDDHSKGIIVQVDDPDVARDYASRTVSLDEILAAQEPKNTDRLVADEEGVDERIPPIPKKKRDV